MVQFLLLLFSYEIQYGVIIPHHFFFDKFVSENIQKRKRKKADTDLLYQLSYDVYDSVRYAAEPGSDISIILRLDLEIRLFMLADRTYHGSFLTNHQMTAV